MDRDSIDRIRSATFPIARKGYEKREVDRYLTKLADWLETGAGDSARSDVVKRELERVGEKTAGILSSAEDSAEQLRAEAEVEAEQTLDRAKSESRRARSEADDYAGRTRSAADDYATKTKRATDQESERLRTEATEDARQALADAEAKARRIVDEGTQRRTDLEAVISDLARHRDAVLADVDRLTSELRAAVTSHTPEPGADRFETPSELDPAEREGVAESQSPRRTAAGQTRVSGSSGASRAKRG